jgi:hypothetical protein
MSEEEKNTQDKKCNQLLADLASEDSQKVIKAIKALEAHGNHTVIQAMMEKWRITTNNEVDAQYQMFFGDLKDSLTSGPIMNELTNEKNADFRIKLLTAIWNSKVDYSDYLVDFVRLASHGEFMETLECLTVIENLDGPFEEHQFLESQLALKEYADKRTTTSDYKAELMSEIARLIKQFEEGHIDY